ncbi:MAG: SMP-30/gluconolactonase/LRE family protein [Caulobacteraceae bacterium]|nr:SMP-30/gluconolactonase/LRE family protein [Caulobacteraceae bacterium]
MELVNARVLAEGLAFPEGPVALSDGSVILVEIKAGRLTRVSADGKKTVVCETGGGPNGAAIGPDGGLYVCNNGGFPRSATPAIQRVDIDTGRCETLYAECAGEPLAGPNDLVFDETGHFWFTDFRGDAIYYAAPDGSRIERMIKDCSGPNGVGLSPDGRTLYWAQTYTRQLLRRRLSEPGKLTPSLGHSLMAVLSHGSLDTDVLVVGLPGARELDSLAVDASGAVCVGSLIEGGITVFDPENRSETLWTLPPPLADRAVTNICFGGPDLRTAYLTCSETGRLVACDWPRPGLKLRYSR